MYNMYIGISVKCSFEENLLMVCIHHHAIAHIMEAFWVKLSYKMWCCCASNALQSTSSHLVCRTQLILAQQRNKPSELCAVWASGPHETHTAHNFILCVHSCWSDLFVNGVIAVCLGCEKQPCLSLNRFFITAWCEKGKQFLRDFVA